MRDPSLDPDWRLIAESIPHIVWTTGADGALDFVNRRGIDYTGTTPEETADWNWLRLVHPDDAERTESAWRTSAETGTPYEHEFRLRRADGSFRWHIARGQPVRGGDGAIVRWVGTVTDIEEQRQFEDRLLDTQRSGEQERALLTTVLHAAPVAFVYLDREARFVRVNDEAAATFGRRADDLIGRSPAELTPWLWEQAEPPFRQVLDSGEPLRAVPVVGAPAGEGQVVREWLVSYYPVRLAGETAGVGLVAVDITDRMHSERVRTAVMSQVTDGVFTEDSEGRLTSLNRAASRMLGWAESELRGRPTHEVIHFQTADGKPVSAADCPLRADAAPGRIVRAVGEIFTRKDGSTFPVACTAVPLRIGTTLEGMAVIFRDVSPRPSARQRIRVLVASADERAVQACRALLDAHEDTEVVEVVDSPAKAVAAVQTHRPDVVIVDHGLPDLDGVETVALIRASLPGVRAVLLVDDHDEDVVLAAVEAGCNGVLEKARAWVEVVAAVEAANRGGTVLSQEELQGVISSARRQEPDRPSKGELTEREREVLVCISEGLSNKQVAERLGLTVNTVRNHVQRILYKLDAHSKLEAVVVARDEGMVDPHRRN
jgi:PAS domain S-box-containing protein